MTRSIDLGNKKKLRDKSKGLAFLRAEWWDDASRFVLVTYSLHGNEYKLRLDLDKMVFLDHSEDESIESELSKRLNLVWQIVVDERRSEFQKQWAAGDE